MRQAGGFFRRRNRAVVLALAAAGVVAVAVPAASGGPARPAGDITRPDRGGDVKDARLTKSERNALDIVSVRERGDKRVGLVVTVTFRGDVEKLIGRGNLRNAGVGLFLRPKSGAGSVAGLVSMGSGPLGRLLEHTASDEVGAIRKGNTLTFFIHGGGFENVASIEVETFDTVSRFRGAGPPIRRPISATQMQRILRSSDPDDLDELTDDLDSLSCDELDQLDGVLQGELERLDAIAGLVGVTDYLDAVHTALLDMHDGVHEILDYPPCGPGDTKLTYALWWDHVQPGVYSDVCAEIMTMPAWPGGTGTVAIAGPGVMGSSSKSFTLGSDGTATTMFEINAFGSYKLSFTAMDKGVMLTGTANLDVTSAPGSKPCR